MDSYLLAAIFGVLSLYFYSSGSTYKSLYRKITQEKEMLEEKNLNLRKLKDKSEKQIKFSLSTISDSQESLKLTRKDYQELKIKYTELENRNKLLQQRVDELYASVGTIA